VRRRASDRIGRATEPRSFERTNSTPSPRMTPAAVCAAGRNIALLFEVLLLAFCP
jgi:hypothetical protein